MTDYAALKARVDALYLEYIFPVLATLRVGEDASAAALEETLLQGARAAGIRVRRYILPAGVPASDALELIREVNADLLLSALLVLRPMPEELDPAALEAALRPEKRLPQPEAGEEGILMLLSRVADAAERKAR